jgi:hypothetical protein
MKVRRIPNPKPKVPPSYNEWSHFFRGYINTSWVESQEKFPRDSGQPRHPKVHRQATRIQAYQVPMAGR